MSGSAAAGGNPASTGPGAPAPVGASLAMLEAAAAPGGLGADDERLLGEVEVAAREAFEAGGPAGTSPVLQPDSQSDPGKRSFERRSEPVPAVPGVLPAGGFAARVGRKRASRSAAAVRVMVAAAGAYSAAALSYNMVARAKAPDLYAEIARIARRTGSTERKVVERIRDMDDTSDPDIVALRPRMAALAAEPEMQSRMDEMAEIERRFSSRAASVTAAIRKIDAAGATGGAVNSAKALEASVGTVLGGRFSALPALDAGRPAAAAQAGSTSPLGRMGAALADMSGRLHAMGEDLSAALGSAMRR